MRMFIYKDLAARKKNNAHERTTILLIIVKGLCWIGQAKSLKVNPHGFSLRNLADNSRTVIGAFPLAVLQADFGAGCHLLARQFEIIQYLPIVIAT